jgi:tRNA-2-methylthio-N6-dimethylallyladenosine synthase
MSKKLYIKTMGCQMNEYDSEKMADVLRESHGYELTDTPEGADLLLVNTCSIREKAQEKVFSQLGRWRKLKDKNPNIKIGVGGCVASQEGEGISKRAPFVDVVFGPQTLHRLPELIDTAEKEEKVVIDISFPKVEKFSNFPKARDVQASAFVSIMEGCSKICSFCVVPTTRGYEVSRLPEQIMDEINDLAIKGVREINLLGQNVNAYLAKNKNGTKVRLADLLKLVSNVKGIERIRYTTSHPLQFTDDLIEAYKDRKMANYLHLPVQSGSDRILKLMRRKYKVERYLDRIEKLRLIRPDISISSDFIVGFPGETKTDFEATLNLVDEVGFDQSFSFIYSPRPNTTAAEMFDDVDHETKLKRLQQLQAKINKNAKKISDAMVETTQTVLVEKKSKKNENQLTGRTENNRWVNFDGPDSLIGEFVDVVITEAMPNSLRGRLAEKSAAAFFI